MTEEKDLKKEVEEQENIKDDSCENKECNQDEKCSCGVDNTSNNECNCGDSCNCSLDNDKLKEEIENLKKTNQELLEKVRYTQAEMVNFRRRKEEEYQNKSKYANQDLITEIIPIVDNFERAIKYDDNDLTDELSKFLDGFKMMYSQLTNVLRNFGVSEISRVGEEFDSNLEEALLTDCIEGYKDDEVLEVLLKGYKLKDRVIRPATVKVNKIQND